MARADGGESAPGARPAHSRPAPSEHAAERPPPRLTVGVIGVGRVGSVLALALQRAGHPIVAANAVSEQSQRRLGRVLPGVPIRDIAQVAGDSDLLLLTVPDDALAPLTAGLVGMEAIHPGQMLVHASGRHATAVLEPATAIGALPLALHPVMTFTGGTSDIDRLAGCPFGVTTLPGLEPVAQALVVEMGGEPFLVAEQERPLYHAALAHGANHLVTLVAQTMDTLGAAGIDEPGEVLAPLLRAALDNALRLGEDALTGPVVRGDVGTVAAHVEVLGRFDGLAAAGYMAMARVTAQRAMRSGRLDPDQGAALLAVLGGTGEP